MRWFLCFALLCYRYATSTDIAEVRILPFNLPNPRARGTLSHGLDLN